VKRREGKKGRGRGRGPEEKGEKVCRGEVEKGEGGGGGWGAKRGMEVWGRKDRGVDLGLL